MTEPGRGADVRIAGSPTQHEVAAVLAALRAFGTAAPREAGYERWRRLRLAALRASLRR